MKEYREGDIELGQRFYTSLIHLLTHHYNNLTKKGGGANIQDLLRRGKQTLLCGRAVISLGTIFKVSRPLKINQLSYFTVKIIVLMKALRTYGQP